MKDAQLSCFKIQPSNATFSVLFFVVFFVNAICEQD